MANTTLCRTCLATNFGKIYYLKYARLREIFEKVTNNKVNIKDGAVGLCYICHAKMQNCWRFYEMAQKSENILKDLFHKQKKITQDTIAHQNKRLTLTVTPVNYFYNGSDVGDQGIVKKEPLKEPVVKEEIIDEVPNEILDLNEKVQEITAVNSDLVVDVKEEMTQVSLNSEGVHLNEDLNKIPDVSVNFDGSVVNVKEELEEITDVPLNSDDFVVILKEEDIKLDYDWGISVPLASEEIIIESNDIPMEFEDIDSEEEIDIEGVVGNHLNDQDVDIELPLFNQTDIPQKVILSTIDYNVLGCDNSKLCNLKTRKNIKKHVQFHKREKQYFICDYCGKSFSSKSSIKSHLSIHLESHSCALCDKKFSKQSYLKAHIKVHARDKTHICQECGKKFTDKSSFNRHQRKVHLDEEKRLDFKKVTCDVCNKKFYNNYYLNSHKRIHTGEKPYKCNFCEKSFSQNGTLKWHRRIHTGEKTHFCELCDKSFYRKAHLLQHMSFHSDERPFICKPCDKSYKSLTALLYHNRNCILHATNDETGE